MLFEFGSRSGSYFALALFGAVFAGLAVGAVIEIRRRVKAAGARTFTVVILLLFVAPVAMIYATSLNGFYEIEVHDSQMSLRYLLMQPVVVLPLARVAEVTAIPAFRGRWRLHVVTTEGDHYESATWHSREIAMAVDQIRARIRRSSTHP